MEELSTHVFGWLFGFFAGAGPMKRILGSCWLAWLCQDAEDH
jgi:hypothetical protein